MAGVLGWVPAEVTAGFTDGRQRGACAAEVSPKVTGGRARVTAAPDTTGFSGCRETAVTALGTGVVSGLEVCSTTVAGAPPATAAGTTGRSAPAPAFAPPGPERGFRVWTDSALAAAAAAPETRTGATVLVSTGEVVAAVEQEAMTTFPETS